MKCIRGDMEKLIQDAAGIVYRVVRVTGRHFQAVDKNGNVVRIPKISAKIISK